MECSAPGAEQAFLSRAVEAVIWITVGDGWTILPEQRNTELRVREVLAAGVLLLVSLRRWMPRRLLPAAGRSATAIVATIGPTAVWSLVTALASGGDPVLKGAGIAIWVPGLFYGSWFLLP